MWKNNYSSFEKSEISQIGKVYYHHKMSKKNYDFDTNSGRLKMDIKNHLIYRFEILKLIDKGSFANVVKVLDHKNQKFYAIKVIKTGNLYLEKSKKEVDILSKFKDHDKNRVLMLYGTFLFRNHLCLIMKLYEMNLTKFIKKKLGKIDKDEVYKIETQIIEGLTYLHDLNIIHGDLKPDNILFTRNGNIVLCDYGLSEYFVKGKKNDFKNIQTLWYRSPEILLKYSYDEMIDYWSLGCIKYEMEKGRVLFKVTNETELFILINVYLGYPSFYKTIKKYNSLYDNLGSPMFIKHNNEIFAFKDLEFRKRNPNNFYLHWDPKKRKIKY